MELFVLFIMLIFGVIPLLGFGYLIAYKQERTIITRWDDDKFHDPVAAATLVGKSIMATGILLLVFTLILVTDMLPAGLTGGLLVLSSGVPLFALWRARKVYGR